MMSSSELLDNIALEHHVRVQFVPGGYIIHSAVRTPEDDDPEEDHMAMMIQTNVALTLEAMLDAVRRTALSWEGAWETGEKEDIDSPKRKKRTD